MLSVSDQIVLVPVYVFSSSYFCGDGDIIACGYCDYPEPARLV